MSDHVVLYVERPESVEEEAAREASGGGGAGPSVNGDDVEVGEDQPLIQVGECRICQEEDSVNNLETPCACSGSLKYAHRKCVQHWCNEKGDITCEICHQQYQPNYTEPPPPPRLEDTAIEIGGGWTISGTPLDLQDPHLLAIAEAERHFLEAEYDASNGGASFCRSAALILIALLLLRHALAIPDADGEEDVATFVSLFILRVAGFLLPCYIIIAWAINTLLRPRQRQEEAAAALAATQVAIVLQSGERRGLQFTIASGSNNGAAQPQESV